MSMRIMQIIITIILVCLIGYFGMKGFEYDYENKMEMCKWCESKEGICNSFSLQVEPTCRIRIDDETYKEYSIFNCHSTLGGTQNKFCFLMKEVSVNNKISGDLKE